MNGNLVTIDKDGKRINVDENSLCKGDMVIIQAGEIVPADLRLVEARALEIDEFDLTGEIMPVIKQPGDEDTLIYKGTRVLKGTGMGIVIATGEQTEYGKIQILSSDQEMLNKFRIFDMGYLGFLLLLLPAFIALLIRSENRFILLGIFLIVSLITLLIKNKNLLDYWSVSSATKDLERLHIQIRDPRALRQMSDIDTICFDKTGVLTMRGMDVTRIYFANPEDNSENLADQRMRSHITKLACALCNDVNFYEKIDFADPIDKALISFAGKNGVKVNEVLMQYRRIYDKPFDSENRYMACGFKKAGKLYYFAKGDPSVIIKRCHHYLNESGRKEQLDANFWLLHNTRIREITQNGSTVIALAYASEFSNNFPSSYSFLCLLQIENLLQPGARDVISTITLNGKRCMLLTGDRDETAAKIGVDSGIEKNSRFYLSGKTIERMALSEVARQSSYCSVFSRLMPSQKALIILLLKQKNKCVAMVGDGPNDGIALKVADVGISFSKNSSPIARGLSKILINDLADLLRLIEVSNRLRLRNENLNSLRTLLLIIVFLSMYVWLFSIYF